MPPEFFPEGIRQPNSPVPIPDGGDVIESFNDILTRENQQRVNTTCAMNLRMDSFGYSPPDSANLRYVFNKVDLNQDSKLTEEEVDNGLLSQANHKLSTAILTNMKEHFAELAGLFGDSGDIAVDDIQKLARLRQDLNEDNGLARDVAFAQEHFQEIDKDNNGFLSMPELYNHCVDNGANGHIMGHLYRNYLDVGNKVMEAGDVGGQLPTFGISRNDLDAPVGTTRFDARLAAYYNDTIVTQGWQRGAMIGAATGGIAGGLLGNAPGAIIGVVGGGLAGALIGQNVGEDISNYTFQRNNAAVRAFIESI